MTKKWIIMLVLSFIIGRLFTGCNKKNEKGWTGKRYIIMLLKSGI